MDSANSGSLQSSSNGSEEYDSRAAAAAADSISAFLNQPPPPPQSHHQINLPPSSAPMFDSLYNFDPNLSRSPLNLDTIWSKNLRSDPNCTDLSYFMAAAPPTQQFLTNGGGGGSENPGITFSSSEKGSGLGLISGSGSADPNQNQNMVRNPKKRSRASRRAPTTVLTTDTTNFRAMVQEFTGIPAPPFTSSHFPRTRLDLFGTGTGSSIRPSNPPFLLRPFAQKIQPPSIVDSVVTPTNPVQSNGLKSPPLHQNLLESSGFNFQTLLQQPPNSGILGTKIQSLDDFGLGHGNNISGIPNLVRRDNNNGGNNPGAWGDSGQHHKNCAGNTGDQFKAPENVGAGRSEGMMESWICSSD